MRTPHTGKLQRGLAVGNESLARPTISSPARQTAVMKEPSRRNLKPLWALFPCGHFPQKIHQLILFPNEFYLAHPSSSSPENYLPHCSPGTLPSVPVFLAPRSPFSLFNALFPRCTSIIVFTFHFHTEKTNTLLFLVILGTIYFPPGNF